MLFWWGIVKIYKPFEPVKKTQTVEIEKIIVIKGLKWNVKE